MKNNIITEKQASKTEAPKVVEKKHSQDAKYRFVISYNRCSSYIFHNFKNVSSLEKTLYKGGDFDNLHL